MKVTDSEGIANRTGLESYVVVGDGCGEALTGDSQELQRVFVFVNALYVAAELVKLGGAKVILATATSGAAMSAVQGGLAVNGTLLVVGAAASMQVTPLLLRAGRGSIKGWYSGTSIDSQDTLAFSARSGVRPMNETFPLERASEAYDRMMSGKARFRVVLTIGR